jgi:peptidoglycan/LPS O-acetylase OafA/YrhL
MDIITVTDKKSRTYNHLDSLLALRGLACLMVVISHCNPPRQVIFYKNYDLTWLTFSFGFVGVWIFFCLSGYLMGKAFYSERYTVDIPGTLNFWRNRALRIFPLYYFAVLILTLFVYPQLLNIENWGYLFRICTFTYDHISSIEFDQPLWSLSTEVQFYIAVPFLYSWLRYYLGTKKKVILTYFYVIFTGFFIRGVVWTVLHVQVHDNYGYAVRYWYQPLITNLDLFLCGFLVNGLLQYRVSSTSEPKIITNSDKKLRLSTSNKKLLAVTLVILLHFFAAYHLYYQELGLVHVISDKTGIRTTTTFFIMPVLTALITAFFIFVFESGSKSLDNQEKLSFDAILRNPLRILEIFGTLSYGIYVWHLPIINKSIPVFNTNVPIEAFYLRLTMALVLSIALATVTYLLVEVPAARWKSYR